MENKRCYKCASIKPIGDFYRNANKVDGYATECKECAKAYFKIYRDEHLEHLREYNRERFQNNMEYREKTLQQSRERLKNNPESVALANKKWLERNPEKTKCHNLLNKAIKQGKVIRATSCQSCGASDVRIHGHHHDYTKPFDVAWLCQPCHLKLHRLERNALRQSDQQQQAA